MNQIQIHFGLAFGYEKQKQNKCLNLESKAKRQTANKVPQSESNTNSSPYDILGKKPRKKKETHEIVNINQTSLRFPSKFCSNIFIQHAQTFVFGVVVGWFFFSFFFELYIFAQLSTFVSSFFFFADVEMCVNMCASVYF